MAAAESEAAKNNWAVVISIIDSGGNIVMLHRRDDVQLSSIEIAQGKAKTALMFKRPSKVLDDAISGGGAGLRFLALKDIVPLEGGVPIVLDGKIVGAIGVSGVLSSQDAQIARAGDRRIEVTAQYVRSMQAVGGMDHRPHIVVVEDEATQRQLLVDYLDKQNFRVSGADGGGRAAPAARARAAGAGAARRRPARRGRLRAGALAAREERRIGIIMVTAAGDTVDRVVGLETGADDYIGKPYEPRELLARIKSVLRRSTGAPAAPGRACAWAAACSTWTSASWSIRPTAARRR